MRSYYAHLENTVINTQVKIAPKPVFRSSAIFPVLMLPGIYARILFMGYWILKRNIKEIAAQINLRNQDGRLLYRSSIVINEAKTYRVELGDQLEKAGFRSDLPFTGSLEVEFFSTTNLMFPFPAVVVNYYGPNFSSVVHTAQRIYNDFDDLKNNSQTHVPESGFNIYADDDHEPFFGIINGGQSQKNAQIELEFYNHKSEILSHTITHTELKPYETCLIYPFQEIDLKRFLDNKPGTAKIKFDIKWIFPRLLVGNIQHSIKAMTITHTYYDCSHALTDSDYWRLAEVGYYPATLMLPLTLDKNHYTNAYFYPIYSPSSLIIDVEIYDSQGRLTGKQEKTLILKKDYQKIDFKKVCEELNIVPEKYMAARVIARTDDGTRIPARIKLGLDLGTAKSLMPCNICTNLQPFNPSLENKPTTFRWGPVLADRPQAMLWIMNSSPHIDYKRDAEVIVTFFREKDTETLKRTLYIKPNGFIAIYANADTELREFFDGKVGWYTAVSTNPYTTTYYFTEDPSGVVGGDHGF